MQFYAFLGVSIIEKDLERIGRGCIYDADGYSETIIGVVGYWARCCWSCQNGQREDVGFVDTGTGGVLRRM